jgi:hypothetical protein
MDDDELEAAAATPESDKLAWSMAAREYLHSAEGEMFQNAAAALSDARLRARDALDALTGLTEPRWQGLGLRTESADALRAGVAALRDQTGAVASVIDRMRPDGMS